MLDLQVECHCGQTIPDRLHWGDRQVFAEVKDDDWLYMRHRPLEGGGPYVNQIPGHDHLGDQSVNSDKINTPDGHPCDVLYDTRGHDQNRYKNWQIARLKVRDVIDLHLPNENTIHRDRDGKIITDADVYTFSVKHTPAFCMYPHCEINAFKNGSRVSDVRNAMRSVIRRKFAHIAEKYRLHAS